MTKTLKFHKNENEDTLICEYSPLGGVSYIYDILNEKGKYTIKRIFTIKMKHLNALKNSLNSDSVQFIIAEKENKYYVLDNEIFGFKNTFFLYEELKINPKVFLAPRGISVLGKIDSIVIEDVIIGGKDGNISEVEFNRLIEHFPNSYELDKYAEMRISSVIQDYLLQDKNYIIDYEAYLNKKISKTTSPREKSFEKEIFENEFKKYNHIKEKLECMLDNESVYSEKDWQKEIAKILTFVYPNYYDYVYEVTFETNEEGKKRVDFVLLDVNGNVDVAEIKKPHGIPIMSKSTDRNNYYPSKNLMGAIMQIEKYLFHINRTATNSEGKIKKKLTDSSKSDIEVHIRNPRGIIIMGKSTSLSSEQLRDFEIVKRKYKNITDIMTYDDLIDRFDRLLKRFNNQKNL
ncbi:Shedu immune nuclease family protein [Tetragenococcus halophilus]|uniref:Shedu immune nuclease family protein n=1 Tax=Tetragenococcus halophilus TaxID=51669 RepID=UPI00209B0BE6|nr:Shedu immune nuclease family protein [Tetragenococcus halophilus]MCO8288792.1 DUF4263 domain-containing protein [Tetragenococcus halophilus]